MDWKTGWTCHNNSKQKRQDWLIDSMRKLRGGGWRCSPATFLSLPDSNFLFSDPRCASDTFPNAQPSSCDGRRWSKRATGVDASQDGPCPRLSEIILWVATGALVVCHAPLAVMSRRPPVQNFSQLGAVIEAHHTSPCDFFKPLEGRRY